jgi:hypothetical protein
MIEQLTRTDNLRELRQRYAPIRHVCHEEGIHPLQTTTQSIVDYIALLGLHGTVAATPLQQYYPAINKVFRDHQQQPIAVGEFLADARRGLEMHQERLLGADSRLTLPTPLAFALLDIAAQIRKHLTWTPPSRHLIATFRTLLAVCTNYAFSGSAEYGVRYPTHDLIVDRHMEKFGCSSGKQKATSDATRPTNPFRLCRSPPTPPSPTSWDGIALSVSPTAQNPTIDPASRTIMELRTLPEFGRLASSCNSPPSSSTLIPPSAPRHQKAPNGHRTASAKVPPPLLAASGPHTTSSNRWVDGPRTIP